MLPLPAGRAGKLDQGAARHRVILHGNAFAELQYAVRLQAQHAYRLPASLTIDMPGDFLPTVVLVDGDVIEGDPGLELVEPMRDFPAYHVVQIRNVGAEPEDCVPLSVDRSATRDQLCNFLQQGHFLAGGDEILICGYSFEHKKAGALHPGQNYI